MAENAAAQIAAARPPVQRRRRARVRAMLRVPLLDSAYGCRAAPRTAGAGRYARGSLSWRAKRHKDAYGAESAISADGAVPDDRGLGGGASPAAAPTPVLS
ncbi:uncharacterized protein SAZU_0972 [Streptomyces azureus]|uniref:Uncharacterized protein n=1 Tax=Streptomyces azureus TaxID=146537 RepID=A0A0K8PED9_STRAJ|nr:uncharacterized protein SAZU_0972 [Streptomyces azureus]